MLLQTDRKTNLTGYPSIDKLQEQGLSFLERHTIIPNVSIELLISMINMQNKDCIAVSMGNLKVTYGQMEKHKRIMARALLEFGISKDDTVVVCLNNSYQAILSFLAANLVGAEVCFLNYKASMEETIGYLNYLGASLLINFNKDIQHNRDIKSKSCVKTIITVHPEDLYNDQCFVNTHGSTESGDFIDFSALGSYSRKSRMLPVNIGRGNSIALLGFTSGSTGEPKIIEITNENIIANGLYCKNTIKLPQNKNERCLSYVPLKYPYGSSMPILTLMCGREIVFVPEGLNEENAKEVLEQITYYYGSPALADLIMKITPDNANLSKGGTFVTGGDFWTDETDKKFKSFMEKHGNNHLVVANGGGNGETDATWSSSVGCAVKPGTAGRILVGSKYLVVDPKTHEEKKYNEEGLLLLQGKHIFHGYRGPNRKTDKEKTERQFITIGKAKYYNTGTIVKVDEERYVTITGRESRYYIQSDGNKVYCEKIQNFLNVIDCVEKSIVVEQPSDITRFCGKAYVVLKEGIEPDENTRKLLFSCCQRTAKTASGEELSLYDYEIPDSIDYIETIKLTEAEKLDFKYYQELAREEYRASNSKD